MKYPRLYPLACLLLVAAATAQSTAPSTRPSAPPPPMPAAFSPLLQRSIFEKGRPVSPGPSTTTQPTLSTPESVKVLNGVTKVNGTLTAFIEDRTTRQITPFRVNDSIARGKVTAITLDALTYEADGKSIRVTVGDNLTGQRAAPASTAPSSPSASDQGASPDAQSVLERLRQRRQQELKQK